MLSAHRGIKLTASSLSIALAALASAQQITLEEAIARGLATSPGVKAADRRAEAAQAAVRRSRAGYNPQLELAPGLGFTNGNLALSQRFDINGARRAETRLAEAEFQTAIASAGSVRQTRAAEVGVLYFALRRARAEEAAARESVALTQALFELVRKRVEIGEAPLIHARRVEVEALRAEQELVGAQGLVAANSAALRLLLDLPAVEVTAELPTDPAPAETQALMALALTNRAEVRMARALLAESQAGVAIARSAGRPSLTAGIAADVWSIDRRRSRSNPVGLQVLFGLPVFDRGSIAQEQRRTELLARAAEAEVAAAEQAVRAELARISGEFEARRQVALNYRTKVLPTVQQLVSASRLGYESGLTTLIELVDAQRAARQTRTEYLTALFQALTAEIDLRRAAGVLAPAMEPPK